jgi:hypothetical protein
VEEHESEPCVTTSIAKSIYYKSSFAAGRRFSDRTKKRLKRRIYYRTRKYTTCDADHPRFTCIWQRPSNFEMKNYYRPGLYVVGSTTLQYFLVAWFPNSPTYSSGIHPKYGESQRDFSWCWWRILLAASRYSSFNVHGILKGLWGNQNESIIG